MRAHTHTRTQARTDTHHYMRFSRTQSNIGNINTYDVYDVCESIGFPGATSQSGAVDVAVDGMMWR
jgi:hypothetical protein